MFSFNGPAQSFAYTPHIAPLRLVLFWLLCTLVFGNLYFVAYDQTLGWGHLVEDQMISMRVARNLAETGSPYFNTGDPVAANTSFFWMYPLALAHLLTADESAAVWAVFWASTTAFAALTMWVAAHLRGFAAQGAAVALIGLSSSALFYGGSGWEHVPQTILITLGFLEILKGQSRAHWLRCFWFAAASFMARPDSAPVIVVIFLAAVWILSPPDRRWFVLRALPALAIPTAYVVGMLHFYGDVVPNTFYLKDAAKGARLTDGLLYVVDPIRSGPAPALCAILLVLWRRLATAERAIAVGFLYQALYIIWIGGDAYKSGRFFLIYLPVLTLIALRRLAEFRLSNLCLAVGVGVMAIGLLQRFGDKVRLHEAHVLSQLRLADKIARHLSPDDGAVGMHYLGVAFRLSDFYVVDFFGKADPVVARGPTRSGAIGHNKWNYEHSFGAYDLVAVITRHQNVVAAEANEIEDAHLYSATDLVATATATGRFDYLSPEDLCVDGIHGLFVRKDVAEAFQRQSCQNG